jgi:hypothetical protein
MRGPLRASLTSNSELSEIVAVYDVRETPPRLLRDVGDKARARARFCRGGSRGFCTPGKSCALYRRRTGSGYVNRTVN